MEVDKKVSELSEKIESKIPTKPYWITCIAFSGNELKEKISKICSDIFMKDRSFRYKIFRNYHNDSDWLLVIKSRDEDTAHKRGTILVKKYLKGENLLYWVKEIK